MFDRVTLPSIVLRKTPNQVEVRPDTDRLPWMVSSLTENGMKTSGNPAPPPPTELTLPLTVIPSSAALKT